ncbi:MAG: alanine racemase [Micavibrio sp.]
MGDFPNAANGILTVDLDAVAANIQILQQKAAPAKLAGVVKANAYGLGLAQIAAVHQALGTETFFVATLDEGIALRALTGEAPEIAVLCGLLPGAEDIYAQYALTPVLNSLEEIARYRSGQDQFPGAMLHIDTGMRRLGLDSHDMKRVFEQPDLLDGIRLSAILSHFACADEPAQNDLTWDQYEIFTHFTTRFPGIRRSLSNSAGIFASPDYHFDLVRPGMAVYGLNPTPDQPNPMRPVVSLNVRVLQIRDALAGESVGYGALYRCADHRRIATVALGYADGFLRALGNKGSLFWQGQACPVVGRVSMDLVTLDITDITGPEPVAGDWVEVLGPHQDADALAIGAGTIGYEILTQLGDRHHRVYSGKTFEMKAVSG